MMIERTLDTLRIVLVEPAGPLNVGSVARIMKNMGFRHLVVVNPQCNIYSEEARRMAVHAQDVLDQAHCVATLPEALVGCQRAIATTGIARTVNLPLEPPQVVLPWLLGVPSALIFGREDRGLSNEELNYAQRGLCIPTHSSYSSLNLAQAVGICCYELYLSLHQGRDSTTSAWFPPPASLDVPPETASLEELNAYFCHLETVLLKIGYLYPHTANRRMEKFKRIFHRAELSASEVAMLRGILRQVEWAMQTRLPSP